MKIRVNSCSFVPRFILPANDSPARDQHASRHKISKQSEPNLGKLRMHNRETPDPLYIERSARLHGASLPIKPDAMPVRRRTGRVQSG